MLYLCFFFFKQKTAYEMRISDWSSDVCSSDLIIWTIKRKQTVERAKRWPYPINLPHGREQRAAGRVLPRRHLCGKKCFVDERADDENLIGARRRCRDLHRDQPARPAQRFDRNPGRRAPRNLADGRSE